MNELSKDAASFFEVGEESGGQRIDNLLVRLLKGVPRSHVYRILRSGQVRLNGRRIGPDARVTAGDRVRIPPIRVAARPVPGTSPTPTRSVPGWNPVPLYEDEALLAIDKPPGLAVHGGSGIARGAIEQLRAARPQAKFLELVHRLDRDTSGVLLLAKKRAALVALHAAWRDGAVDKRYLVLVRGRWRDAKRTVELPVHRYVTHAGERRVRVEDEGRGAATTFRRERTWPERDPPLALLEAELHTGRTHQIRVHLTHLGFPLAGDAKYGDFAWNRALAKAGLKRMFLHARRLAFAHPLDGRPVEIVAPLPPDLVRFLASLERA